MSATLFLEPVSQDKRVIFVNIRNTSDKELDIAARITSALTARGYVLLFLIIVVAAQPVKPTNTIDITITLTIFFIFFSKKSSI
jgi:hypothetical protein